MTDKTAELEARMNELEERVAELEELASHGEIDNDTPDLRTFVEQTDPGSHVERAAAIGYFLEHYSDYDNFTTNDINAAYETCRVPKPANMTDNLNQLENQDLSMEITTDGREKAWQLTATGEEFVESQRRSA